MDLRVLAAHCRLAEWRDRQASEQRQRRADAMRVRKRLACDERRLVQLVMTGGTSSAIERRRQMIARRRAMLARIEADTTCDR